MRKRSGTELVAPQIGTRAPVRPGRGPAFIDERAYGIRVNPAKLLGDGNQIGGRVLI
jgi:hypothetical protein